VRGKSFVYALLAALAVTALGAIPGRAAPPPDHTLTGQTPDVVAHGKAKQIGHHKADDVLTLDVVQSVRDTAGMDAFIAAVSDRHNPLYKHYLTKAQYKAQYAPTDQDTQAVQDWATGAGLAVSGVSPDNLLVSVQGTTDKVEKALGVTINDYERADGSLFRSNDRDATVPAGLDIQAVSELSTYDRPVHADIRVDPNGVAGYFPNDFATAYDMTPTVGDASLQYIGLTLWGGKEAQSDLNTFATQSGTPRLVGGQGGENGIDWIGVNGNPMTDTSTLDEVALDSEFAHGVAPDSHLKYWLGNCDYDSKGHCSGDTRGLALAINAAVNDADVRIVSNSWGLPEVTSASNQFVQQVEPSLQEAAASGTTFYFSTGDEGSNSGCFDPANPGPPSQHPCPPLYPASSRYVVAVGGTSLDTNADYSYKSETAWDDAGNVVKSTDGEAGGASGGGCATYFPRPSWQTLVPVTATNDGSPCSGRAIPDVAAAAGGDSPANVYYQGKNHTIVGTSLAAPLWAGMTADLNDNMGGAGFFLTGFAAPQLYQFAHDSSFDPTLFHDITAKEPGPGDPYGAAYPAGPGWDEATGLGSVDAGTLLSYLESYNYPATIYAFAGTGASGFDCPTASGRALTTTALRSPGSVATDKTGNVYITDDFCSVVYKVDPQGNIALFAGQVSNPGYSGDGGPATSAQLDAPVGIAVGTNGIVYIADENNNRIREVTTDGKIHTFAGTGDVGYNGTNMPATQTSIDHPMAVAVNNSNNVYVTDSDNFLVRRIDPTGKMTIVAGVPSSFGYNGDNIPATSATLTDPVGVAADSRGNVFIAERDGNRIREVTVSDGKIHTYAGTGTAGDTGDAGAATAGQISSPYGLALDSFNNLYFSEGTNHVREVIWTDGTLFTVAGTGACGNTGDGGGAFSATLCTPQGLAFDKGESQLFIADTGNARVRRLANTPAS